MAYVKRKRVKIEDKISYDAITLSDVAATLKDNIRYAAGAHIKIGNVVMTPDGLYYRLANSTRWLHESVVGGSSYPLNMIRDFTNKENLKKEPAVKEPIKKIKTFKETRSKSLKRFGKNEYTNKKGIGVFGMNKTELRNALTGLQPDDNITIDFIDEGNSVRTEEFVVLRTKKGKGKGGSQLVELKHATTGEFLITGTPNSESILNVRTPSGLYGHTTLEEVPPSFATDKEKAKTLKEIFVNDSGNDLRSVCTLLPKRHERDTRSRFVPENEDVRFKIESTFAPLDGTFRLARFELMRGRYGKIMAYLTNEDNNEVEFDTFAHSTVVTNITRL